MFETTLNRLRNGRRADDGFTLIELLMVIIILAILAAVVVFSVRAIDDNGEEAACEAEVRAVETAIEAYYAENANYPGTVGALTTAGFLRSDPEGPPDGASQITGATTISAAGALPAAALAC